MSKGLALFALVLSIVALIVAGAGLIERELDVEATGPDPNDDLAALQRQLTEIHALVEKTEGKILEADGRIVRLEEATNGLISPAAKMAASIPPEIQRLVRQLIQAEMNRRVVAAKARPATARSGGATVQKAPQMPRTKADKKRAFIAMVKSLQAYTKAEGNRLIQVDNALTVAREAMNKIYRDYRKNKDVKTRDRRLLAARRAIDAKLRQHLPTTAYQQFQAWKRVTQDPYAKMFFGLK